MSFGDHKSSATEKIKCHKSTPQHRVTHQSMCVCVQLFKKLHAPQSVYRRWYIFMYAYDMVNLLVVMLNFVKLCSFVHTKVQRLPTTVKIRGARAPKMATRVASSRVTEPKDWLRPARNSTPSLCLFVFLPRKRRREIFIFQVIIKKSHLVVLPPA